MPFLGRQLFAFTRQQPRMLNRFYSIETPVDTAVQTPSSQFPDQPEFDLEPEAAVERRTPNEANLSPHDAWKQRQRQSKWPGHWDYTPVLLGCSAIDSTLERQFQQLGSTITNAYRPDLLIKNPPNANQITLEYLLASQTHLGHSTSRWNPRNSRYIFGIRDGIHIISLDVTAAHLRRAAKVVEEVAARGGLILFSGTRDGQKAAVVRAASLAKGYHIFERWIPGSLTNGQQILGHCETKVVNAYDQELEAFKPLLEERAALKPDLVVCFNPVESEVLLHECGLNNVPTIGVIDTDADPSRVTYPIPSNDDSLRAIGVIAGVLGRAGQDGQARRLNKANAGQFTYKPIDPEDLGVDNNKFAELQRKGAGQSQQAIGESQGAEQVAAQLEQAQQVAAQLQQQVEQHQQETAQPQGPSEQVAAQLEQVAEQSREVAAQLQQESEKPTGSQ